MDCCFNIARYDVTAWRAVRRKIGLFFYHGLDGLNGVEPIELFELLEPISGSKTKTK